METTNENIAGRVLTYNSKKLSFTKQKADLERTMSELGKPFPKKSDKKFKKNKINVKMPHVNKKPLARRNLVQTKKN